MLFETTGFGLNLALPPLASVTVTVVIALEPLATVSVGGAARLKSAIVTPPPTVNEPIAVLHR